MLDALSRTGVRRIEAVSFVHPEAIPQMADADEVWAGIERAPGVRYSALVPNRAARSGPARRLHRDRGGGLGQRHPQPRNVNRSTAESLDDIAVLIEELHRGGATAEVIIATSFGCPYEGEVDPARVARIVDRVIADGADRISFGDTTGMATPRRVRGGGRRGPGAAPRSSLLLHFHNTRGTALANLLTALELGVIEFDASVGGLGGCPYAPGPRQCRHRGGGAHAPRHGHQDRGGSGRAAGGGGDG